MKKIIAINGSPRKNRNTATLLQKALNGAESVGSQTELIHLYDFSYKGCISCFSCKKTMEKASGCAIKDDLSPVLEKAMNCDAIILGSPIYLSDITSSMRAFMERLIFMNLSYNDSFNRTNFTGNISTAFIYTMGVDNELMDQIGYDINFQHHARYLKLLGGTTEHLISSDTYQFDDYSKYATNAIDVAHKEKVKNEQLPKDFQKAFELGIRISQG